MFGTNGHRQSSEGVFLERWTPDGHQTDTVWEWGCVQTDTGRTLCGQTDTGRTLCGSGGVFLAVWGCGCVLAVWGCGCVFGCVGVRVSGGVWRQFGGVC